MPPSALTRALSLAPRWSVSEAWRRALTALGFTWGALIALFHRDLAAMAGQWWNSSTYSHILLVPAILVWLVAVRTPQLRLLSPHAWRPGLALVVAAAIVWLLGSLASLSLLSQAGLVAMLAAAAVTVLGPKVSTGLAFPLGYMAFLVPFGDELVPALQLITAKLTVGLVHLSGMQATIDGVFIETPAGLFEVAEACSGVKFLIAMVAFGALVANVGFRSWRRRAAFLSLAIVLPILANGVRAWGTVFVAQFVGAERATGFDHLIYGWIFFAVVIAATLGLSWRSFDRGAADPMIDAAAIEASPVLTRFEGTPANLANTCFAMTAVAILVLTWAGAANRLEAAVPEHVDLPDVPGWQQVAFRPSAAWAPRPAGADHRLIGRYRDAVGREVDVFYALYSAQEDGQEADGFGQGALAPDSGWSWLSPGPMAPNATSERLMGPGQVERVAETRYRRGTLLTGSGLRLRLRTLGSRLLLRAETTSILILSAEQQRGRDAAASLRAFRASVGPLGPWMDRIAGVR